MSIDEILTDIGSGVQYTLHAHTQFCDSRATMADFIAEAVHLSFTHFGFTPHSPVPIESKCNMSTADVPVYFGEIERLRALYPQIKIMQGMEIDYLGDSWGPAHEYFRKLPLDFSIGSVHFIPTQDGDLVDIDGRPDSFLRKLQENFHGDVRYIVDTFFDHSIAMVEAGGFDIIGHFDKIKLNASYAMPDIEATEWYNSRVNELIDAIIAHNLVVEINTKSWKEFQHLFPAQRHWRTLINAGIRIVVNSDAHYTDRLNASRPEVLKALRYLRSAK